MLKANADCKQFRAILNSVFILKRHEQDNHIEDNQQTQNKTVHVFKKEKKKNDNKSTGVRSFVEWITAVEVHFYNLHIDIKQG